MKNKRNIGGVAVPPPHTPTSWNIPANETDANAIIIGNFLIGYSPADEYGPGVKVVSTDDIISALADMADLTQDDVNRILANLGYKPGYNDVGSFGWLFRTSE